MIVTAPASSDPNSQLRDRRDALKAALAAVGDLRPGSLGERYRKCGKANCHCAAEDARGHGPVWVLTREVAGRTVTTVVPIEAVEQTRRQIAEYQRFRALASELVEASERWCQAQLGQAKAASEEVAKKGASRRPSKSKSSGRSKR